MRLFCARVPFAQSCAPLRRWTPLRTCPWQAAPCTAARAHCAARSVFWWACPRWATRSSPPLAIGRRTPVSCRTRWDRAPRTHARVDRAPGSPRSPVRSCSTDRWAPVEWRDVYSAPRWTVLRNLSRIKHIYIYVVNFLRIYLKNVLK